MIRNIHWSVNAINIKTHINGSFNMKLLYANSYCMLMLTEFYTIGNWGCNVPTHPGLPPHQSQPNECYANMCNLHNISML